ncbi:MAG: hypothetical protein ACQEP3_00485 [Patescibacteria group bacterium]
MNKRIEKPFLIVVMIVFSIVAALHFVRLSLEWEFLIADWSIPSLLSGFIIVVSVFITYWAWIILNYEEENKSIQDESKEELPEEDKQIN